MMKRWALIAAGGVIVPTVFAAVADSGQIRLRGEVPTVCTVGVIDRGVILDLSGANTRATVAAIEERCNAPNGYTVTLSSRNGGELRLEDARMAGIAYSMSYPGASQSRPGALVAVRSEPGAGTRDLAITTPAAAGAPAGVYEDIVTVSIAAK